MSGRTWRRGRPGQPPAGRREPTAAALATGTLAAGLARAAYTALRRRPPGGADTWTRTNHRGEPVTLAEGPALALAAIAAPLAGRGLPPRLRAAQAVAGAGAAAFGGYDDLAGDGDRRGFRGHLGALAQGEVTTGAVKLGGIGATGLVAAAMLGGGPADVAINAGLVAGGANLLNLFDLRPGRALKVALASSALLAAAPPGRNAATQPGAVQTVAAPVGAALALLGEDLGERAMLGDAGANALGALLGVAAAASLPRPARVALLAGIAGLTAASEKVSFTAVIERTPALKWLDMLGRRPVPATPAPGRPAGPLRQVSRGIGRAAALIGGITVIARVVGFGRQLVFAHTVGSHCLGTAYATANQVPNIIYDIVLGGALTSAVVPVLAGAAARRAPYRAAPLSNGSSGITPVVAGPDTEASQIASALLTWTVVLLAPASLIVALVARPLAALLLAGVPNCAEAAAITVSSRMLVVFAPQILLYGLAVVLYGILQAHRRFTAPALAPVVSSLVVIAAYLAFVPLSAGSHDRLPLVPLPAQLVLSVGTTAGVAALVLIALGPALRLRLRLRPALRFPDGVARRVRGLAAVGFATLLAQDASLVAVMLLANSRQGQGAVVLYNYGWQMFFVPYAVLAVPIATSVFPELSASDGPAFDRTAAASTRAAMLVSWLGAALLAGAAWPAAHLFVSNPSQARQLALAFIAFAPGLVGYGLAAALSRVLFASGRNRLAAVALIGGWLVVTAVDVAVVPLVRAHWVVPVLGLGNTVGLTFAGIALVVAVRASRGPAALRGSGRAAAAGLAGAIAGGLAGGLVSAGLRVTGFFPNAFVTVLACACAMAVFAAAVLALDGGDLRVVAGRTIGRWFR